MKQVAAAGVVALLAFAVFARPVPSAALMERLRAEEDVIGIVHWGLNTYTDRERGFLPPCRQPPAFTRGKRTGTVRLLLEATAETTENSR